MSNAIFTHLHHHLHPAKALHNMLLHSKVKMVKINTTKLSCKETGEVSNKRVLVSLPSPSSPDRHNSLSDRSLSMVKIAVERGDFR